MKTTFQEVSVYSDDFVRLQVFAKSFNHQLHPSRNTRVVAFERGGITFGYGEIVHVPVVFPAFHPQISTPRAVHEVLTGYKSHCQISSGGDGLMGIPLDSERSTFPREMLEKAGFSRMEREIYVLNNSQ